MKRSNYKSRRKNVDLEIFPFIHLYSNVAKYWVMANLLHKYSQFSIIHVWVVQGRYLTNTVCFFLFYLPFIFIVPPKHTHTPHTHSYIHTHTHKLSYTHTHIPLCPKQVRPRTAYSGGYKRCWSLRKPSLFLFSLTAGFPFLNISWGGKGKKEEGRKGNHGISSPAQQCRLWETEGSCSLCAGISLAILLKLWGVFLSAAPTLPPFLPKLLVVTEWEADTLGGGECS